MQNYAVGSALDRVRRADCGAGRLIAMHANDGSRLDRILSLNRLQVDHRDASMGIAFRTGRDAGVASNAAAGIDIKLPLSNLNPP